MSGIEDGGNEPEPRDDRLRVPPVWPGPTEPAQLNYATQGLRQDSRQNKPRDPRLASDIALGVLAPIGLIGFWSGWCGWTPALWLGEAFGLPDPRTVFSIASVILFAVVALYHALWLQRRGMLLGMLGLAAVCVTCIGSLMAICGGHL